MRVMNWKRILMESMSSWVCSVSWAIERQGKNEVMDDMKFEFVKLRVFGMGCKSACVARTRCKVYLFHYVFYNDCPYRRWPNATDERCHTLIEMTTTHKQGLIKFVPVNSPFPPLAPGTDRALQTVSHQFDQKSVVCWWGELSALLLCFSPPYHYSPLFLSFRYKG